MAIRKLPDGRRAVEFELRGHRIFRRLPSGATKAQAEEYELKLRRDLIDQGMLGKTPSVGLAYAVREWFKEAVTGRKDEAATRSKVNLVCKAIEGLMLTKAGVVEAAKHIHEMKRVKGEKPFTAATLNRRLSVVKGAATWAWKVKHWTPENLSPYVILIDKRKEKVRDRTITQSEIERLIRHAPNFEARAFIALGCYGLMREGEIVKARPEHIQGRSLKLKDRKTGATIMLPVLPELKPFVKAIPFTYHVRTLYGWFEEARDAAGLKDLVFHDLRRSGATILLNNGVPLEIVAAILGDSLDVARKHYAHVLNRTLEKAMRKGFKPIKNPSAKSRVGVSH